MKEIKIQFDYKCYPLWIYDDGIFIDNDLPKELSEDKDFDQRLVTLQRDYDNLFVDTDVNFEYKGFKSEDEKQKFNDAVVDIEKYLQSTIGETYMITNSNNI